MTAAWSFERRRDTCAQLLVGAHVLAKGLADTPVSLEAARARMRLARDEGLFAARRLHDEEAMRFDARDEIRLTPKGLSRTQAVFDTVRARVARFDDVASILRAGGTALAVVAAVRRAEGGALDCGAPDDDPDARYRLALVGDAVTLERRRDDGAYEPVPSPTA